MQSRLARAGWMGATTWLVGLYALFIGVGAGVGWIAGAPEPWERELIEEIAGARTEPTGRSMVAITHLGDAITVTVGLAALAVGATMRKARAWVPFFCAALVGAIGIHPVVKVLIERARPIDSFIDVGGYAFPSGHAAASAALATAVIVFFVQRLSGWRWRVVVVCAVLYATAVGFSRIFLGVHWPTDVVGGWTIGAAWVLVIARALRRDGNP